jgi:peroxin-11B
LTRKILRVGKFVEHFKAAAQAADSRTLDPVLKFLAVSRQLGYAGYLTLDTATVLDATGVKKWGGAKRASTEAMRFWLMGIASSIVAGVYTLNRLRLRRQVVDKKEGEGVVESKKIERYVQFGTSRTDIVAFWCFADSLLTLCSGNGTRLFFK